MQSKTFVEQNYNEFLQLLKDITLVPSPPFKETKRAEYIKKIVEEIHNELNNTALVINSLFSFYKIEIELEIYVTNSKYELLNNISIETLQQYIDLNKINFKIYAS